MERSLAKWIFLCFGMSWCRAGTVFSTTHIFSGIPLVCSLHRMQHGHMQNDSHNVVQIHRDLFDDLKIGQLHTTWRRILCN